MKPEQFAHHRPETLEEALQLLDDFDEAELLAGNQSLGIVMSNRLASPDHLIDLNGIDALSGIDITDDEVTIGAMTRHRTIERSDELATAIPMLPEAAEQIAGPTVRNRGTMGGSLAEADPAGNYGTALVALDGRLDLRSVDGTREIPAEDFFLAYMFTDMHEHELIESVTIDRDPFPVDRTGMAFLELKRAAQTWPTVSAATAIRVDDPTAESPIVEEARLALANVSDVPLRVPEAEELLVGTEATSATLTEIESLVQETLDPEGEMHASSEFKAEVGGVYARRSFEASYARAQGDSYEH